MPIIVVEGPTDATFFSQLNRLRPLSLEPRPAFGKNKIPDVPRPLIDPGTVTPLLIAEDLNGRQPAEIIQIHKDWIGSSLNTNVMDVSEPEELFQVEPVPIS